MYTIITLIAVIISIIMFFLPYWECRYAHSISLSGLWNNVLEGGKKLLYEIITLAAVLGIFFVVYLILDELGDSYPGCVYVPLFVILWVIVRGMYLPLGFIKNFESIASVILFIVIYFVIYKAVIWWVTEMMLEANSLVAALVFGGLLVLFARYIGRITYGLIACACEK